MNETEKLVLRCRICGADDEKTIYNCKEHRINNGDHFRYMKCRKCGTLSLIDMPDDIGKYYRKEYYSHNIKKTASMQSELIKSILHFVIKNRIWIPVFLRMLLSDKIGGNFLKIYRAGISCDSFICDVGAGNGAWGARLYDMGYKNVHCVDQYVDSSPYDGISFECCDFEEMSKNTEYDLITLHHSFEHMINPDRALKKITELLKKDGLCIIRIPVCDSKAWEIYHENWFQIDAPRHYYLYTRKAMELLCRRNGLYIERVVCDSNWSQFAYSKLFSESDISFVEAKEKGKKEKIRYFFRTWFANATGRGDQAMFYVRKS